MRKSFRVVLLVAIVSIAFVIHFGIFQAINTSKDSITSRSSVVHTVHRVKESRKVENKVKEITPVPEEDEVVKVGEVKGKKQPFKTESKTHKKQEKRVSTERVNQKNMLPIIDVGYLGPTPPVTDDPLWVKKYQPIDRHKDGKEVWWFGKRYAKVHRDLKESPDYISPHDVELPDIEWTEKMKTEIDSSGYEPLRKLYNAAFRALNELGIEWTPSEGSLIGILRYGSNWIYLPDFGLLETDSDLDIDIRVRDEEHTHEVGKFLSKRIPELMGGGGASYRIDGICNYMPGTRNDRLFLRTSGGHVDIHTYLVDEERNIVYYQPETKAIWEKCFPLSKWNGSVLWRGYWVKENGEQTKCLYEDGHDSFEIPCLHNWRDLLEMWNDGEYHNKKMYPVDLPVGGNFQSKGRRFKDFVGDVWGRFSSKDRRRMGDRCKEVREKGYETFHCELFVEDQELEDWPMPYI